MRLNKTGSKWALLSTTYHLLPIIYHLPPIAYYLLPTTYYLMEAAWPLNDDTDPRPLAGSPLSVSWDAS